jgi:hypothetical protein
VAKAHPPHQHCGKLAPRPYIVSNPQASPTTPAKSNCHRPEGSFITMRIVI